jgi:hypothetical protein
VPEVIFPLRREYSREEQIVTKSIFTARRALSVGVLAAVGVLGMAGGATVSEAAQNSEPSVKVIAHGLNNPRGIEFNNGAVYVAEAGKGGSECFGQGGGPEGQACYGKTGAVIRIEDGKQVRVIKGLPSVAGEDGAFATGPHDVSFSGSGEQQKLFVTVGEGPRKLTGDRRFSRLLRVKESGGTTNVADLLAYERENNPDDGADPFSGDPELNSNPYSTVTLPNGGHVVADAGGNSLIKVKPDGGLRTRAVFPTRSVENPEEFDLPPGFRYQSVPDALAAGPDGELYVGELTGFPFPKGEARVYRLKPGSKKPKVYAEGFTNIIDVAVGPDGSVYVLEFVKKGLLQAEGPDGDPSGRLVRIHPNGKRRVVADGDQGLTFPAGVTIGPKGAAYVSNFGVFPESGKVLRIK